jgi:hypothetical protein
LGGGEKSGPADEYDALRARLLKLLRRSPGDTRALTRIAGELSRIMAAEHGMSPRRAKDLAERFSAAMESVEKQLFPDGR